MNGGSRWLAFIGSKIEIPPIIFGGDSNQWEKFLSTLTIDRLRNMENPYRSTVASCPPVIVGDGRDNVIIAITGTNGNGIAVVGLSSRSEPDPLPHSEK